MKTLVILSADRRKYQLRPMWHNRLAPDQYRYHGDVKQMR